MRSGRDRCVGIIVALDPFDPIDRLVGILPDGAVTGCGEDHPLLGGLAWKAGAGMGPDQHHLTVDHAADKLAPCTGGIGPRLVPLAVARYERVEASPGIAGFGPIFADRATFINPFNPALAGRLAILGVDHAPMAHPESNCRFSGLVQVGRAGTADVAPAGCPVCEMAAWLLIENEISIAN